MALRPQSPDTDFEVLVSRPPRSGLTLIGPPPPHPTATAPTVQISHGGHVLAGLRQREMPFIMGSELTIRLLAPLVV